MIIVGLWSADALRIAIGRRRRRCLLMRLREKARQRHSADACIGEELGRRGGGPWSMGFAGEGGGGGGGAPGSCDSTARVGAAGMLGVKDARIGFGVPAADSGCAGVTGSAWATVSSASTTSSASATFSS